MDPGLKASVERMLECTASFVEDVIVVEKVGGKVAWNGTVSVFNLEGHPQATKAYAWSSPIEGSAKRRYCAVLHIPPVDSPDKAVRASLVQDRKAGKVK